MHPYLTLYPNHRHPAEREIQAYIGTPGPRQAHACVRVRPLRPGIDHTPTLALPLNLAVALTLTLTLALTLSLTLIMTLALTVTLTLTPSLCFMRPVSC